MTLDTLTVSQIYTVDEYFVRDERSEEKLEYHNGTITAMSGGTTTHSEIAAKLITALSILLDEQPYKIYTSDIKIQMPAYNKFAYADASVVQGAPQHYQGRRDTIVNPLLVVEVLSPSTQRHDRHGKFVMYRTLPSLSECVLIEQDRPRVTTFYRNEAGHWQDTDVIDLDQSVRLQSLDGDVSLARLYKGIDFTAQ